MARRRTSDERLAAYRHERRLQRTAELERLRAKRLRVAKAVELMVGGQSLTAAAREARTTPAAIRAETSPGSLLVRNGRVVAASPSRIRIDLGTATIVTPAGDADTVRLRTLRDWLVWRDHARLIDLAIKGKPVPPGLEQRLRGASIDGTPVMWSGEAAGSVRVQHALDDRDTLSPTLSDDTSGAG